MVESTEKAINLDDSATNIQIAEIEREPSYTPVSADEKSAIKATPKATVVSTPARPQGEKKASVQELLASEPEAPKTDELETLWPGVHQDLHQEFINPIKKTPSALLTVGFIGGAILSLFAVWGYSAFSGQDADVVANQDKPILIQANSVQDSSDANTPVISKNVDPTAPLEPICKSYEVKSGDTLVSIALKNYRKVTPRLIDSIVEQNNLKNADTLGLGQKLSLPTYHPSNARLAATKSAQIN